MHRIISKYFRKCLKFKYLETIKYKFVLQLFVLKRIIINIISIKFILFQLRFCGNKHKIHKI